MDVEGEDWLVLECCSDWEDRVVGFRALSSEGEPIEAPVLVAFSDTVAEALWSELPWPWL